MLMSLLDECIDGLKEIEELESLSNDTKKQEKIEKDFNDIVTLNDLLLCNLYSAKSKIDFRPSTDFTNMAINILVEIEKVIASGRAKDNLNLLMKKEYKNLEELISQEWNNFYRDKSLAILNLLNIVIDITPDKIKTKQIINKIEMGSNWPLDERKLTLMQLGLLEGEEIIKSMGLDNEIISFIEKVGSKSATLADLTTDILKWIERKQLATKLSVNFVVDCNL